MATTSLALNGGTIRDAATNNATLTLAAPGAAGSLGANKALVVDDDGADGDQRDVVHGERDLWAGRRRFGPGDLQ